LFKTFPSIWDAEERRRGSVVRSLLVSGRGQKVEEEEKYVELGRLEMMSECARAIPKTCADVPLDRRIRNGSTLVIYGR
jgi:hypothetical protein